MATRNPNVRRETGELRAIGDLLQERNIELDTKNPLVQQGFVQIPSFILRLENLSAGAKVIYSMFLDYAWHNDYCFPGQERLANDIGMSRSRVSEFVSELQQAGLVTIKRRGQGKTNIYKVHFQVQGKRHQR
jgi:hypothetical protein